MNIPSRSARIAALSFLVLGGCGVAPAMNDEEFSLLSNSYRDLVRDWRAWRAMEDARPERPAGARRMRRLEEDQAISTQLTVVQIFTIGKTQWRRIGILLLDGPFRPGEENVLVLRGAEPGLDYELCMSRDLGHPRPLPASDAPDAYWVLDEMRQFVVARGRTDVSGVTRIPVPAAAIPVDWEKGFVAFQAFLRPPGDATGPVSCSAPTGRIID